MTASWTESPARLPGNEGRPGPPARDRHDPASPRRVAVIGPTRVRDRISSAPLLARWESRWFDERPAIVALKSWQPDVVVRLNRAGGPGPAAGLEGLEVIDLLCGPVVSPSPDRDETIALAAIACRHGPEGPVLARASAPIYPRDSGRRIEARADELAVHVLELAFDRLRTAEAGPEPAEPEAWQFLNGGRRTRWRVLRGVRRLGAKLADPRSWAKAGAYLVARSLFRPIRDAYRTLRRTQPVRIFTFHRVSDLCRDGLTVPPDVFRRQLHYIRRHHRVVSLEEALALLRDGARLRKPVAVLTFDDAYRSVRRHAAPILAELGLSACCFAPTGLVASESGFPWDAANPVGDLLPAMTWAELDELHRAGWTIGGHTATHVRLSDCDPVRLREELESPIRTLHRELGIDRVPMAYPFGGPDDFSEEARQLAEELGYTACLSNYGGENVPPRSPFELRRIDLGGDFGTIVWKAWVHGLELRAWTARGRERPRWDYVGAIEAAGV